MYYLRCTSWFLKEINKMIFRYKSFKYKKEWMKSDNSTKDAWMLDPKFEMSVQ